MKYTKGPWLQRAEKYDDWGIIRSKESGWVVAKAEAGCHITEEQLNEHRTNKTDPYEANARLIAAAPDLYEALLLQVTRYEDGPCFCVIPEGHTFLSHEPWCTAARAALAKAEGSL